MDQYNRRRIREVLLKAASVSPAQMENLLAEQRSTKISLGKLLINKKAISEVKLLSILEEQLGIAQVNLYQETPNRDALDSITFRMAQKHRVIPLAIKDKKMVLAMADPMDLTALDEITTVSGYEVNPVIAGSEAIASAINQYYAMREDPVGVEHGADSALLEKEENSTPESPVDHAPVVKVVNFLIRIALEKGASDIHLEPSDQGLRIRMRLDGILYDMADPPRHKQAHIISRVKIMANLDIAEKRLPQDGNIQQANGEKEINLRVSTMPTIHGEKIVIRLLEKEKIILPLKQLGFADANYRSYQRLLLNQSGMLLVTGPTGCGKTTTLYSALNYLNRARDNIITVEDPVECRIRGINQIQVNRQIDRTFANTLRSILRQDPDIIMVGEIRDLETAKIATQAALTGHMVMSTLHTNNAVGAVTRLIDMGLEPFMVTAALVGVIAQRLVRKICEHCREEYTLTAEEKVFYQNYFQKDPPPRLYRGGKCKHCSHTGYRGRSSIQEILLLSQDLQSLILKGETAVELQVKALEQGMLPLISDGLRCLEGGITTIGEVVRATFSSVFDAEASGYADSSAFINHMHKDSN